MLGILLLASSEPQAKVPRVLFLTHSAGFKHDCVKRPAPDKLSIAEEALVAAAKGRLEIVASQDCTEIAAEKLKSYSAVVFYTSGELPIDKDALFTYVKSGGGFVCIHNGVATLMKVPAYAELVGGFFDGHPWNQEIKIKVEDPKHPSTSHWGASFSFKEEVYQVKE